MIVIELFEARAQHDEIEYTEKKAKGVLDKVIAVLSGNKSGKYTRLAQRYKRVDRLAKLLKKERDELNAAAKEQMAELFDEEDATLTRVIETASLTLTLSKETGPQKTEYFDVDGYVEALEGMVPELAEQIQALRKQYTTINEVTKKPSLRVKVAEGPLDALWDKVKNYAGKAAAAMRKKFGSYDDKLDALRSRMMKDGALN